MSIALALLLAAPSIDKRDDRETQRAFPPVAADARRVIEVPDPAPIPLPATADAPASLLPPSTSADDTEPADIVVVGRRDSPDDPLVGINGPSFAVSQAIDDAVVAPIAGIYNHTVPGPIRSGIGNFLSNLREPVVFLNYLLQGKPGKAAETLGRFAINTTLGAAGLFDVAKRRPFKLPFRSNGFANTFAIYGIKPGPFLFLPIVGATTPRDFIGLFLDRLVLPLAVGSPFDKPAFTIPTGLLHTIGRRNEVDATLRRTRATADPYVTRRDLYLKARQAEIDRLRGRPVAPEAPPPAAAH